MSNDMPPAGGFVHGFGLPVPPGEATSNDTPPTKPPRRKWRKWAIIAALLMGVLLVLCVTVPQQLNGLTNKDFARYGCTTLAGACDAFVGSASNTNEEPPRTLDELHRPPWGGDSFLPDGEHNLRDPWGNLYLMQPRKRPDGLPYLLIVTNAPDGTLISQHGLGPKAVPPADRTPPPSKGEVIAATWLNRGTALGLLLGVCIGAVAVAVWYSTRNRPKEAVDSITRASEGIL